MAFAVPIFSEGFGGTNAIRTLLLCLATLPRCAARWRQCRRSRRRIHVYKNTANQIKYNININLSNLEFHNYNSLVRF
jgi:hypothetical protein